MLGDATLRLKSTLKLQMNVERCKIRDLSKHRQREMKKKEMDYWHNTLNNNSIAMENRKYITPNVIALNANSNVLIAQRVGVDYS